MTTTGVIDDHILEHYRALLDAEDSAFNEVEHAYEEGDRKTFEHDLLLWREALRAKLHYLERCGIDLVGTSWEPAPAST